MRSLGQTSIKSTAETVPVKITHELQTNNVASYINLAIVSSPFNISIQFHIWHKQKQNKTVKLVEFKPSANGHNQTLSDRCYLI